MITGDLLGAAEGATLGERVIPAGRVGAVTGETVGAEIGLLVGELTGEDVGGSAGDAVGCPSWQVYSQKVAIPVSQS